MLLGTEVERTDLMPGKSTRRGGRTSKSQTQRKTNMPGEALARSDMSWGSESGLGMSKARRGEPMQETSGRKTSGRKSSRGTSRSLSRQPQATAPMRRGKSKRSKASSSTTKTGRAKGRSQTGRKSSRAKRSRAT